MKRLLVTSLAIVALSLAAASFAPAQAQNNFGQALQGAAGQAMQNRSGHQKSQAAPTLSQAQLNAHPAMARVISQLDSIEYQLAHDTADDFKGHKAMALKLVGQANKEMKQAIADAQH